MFLDATKPLVSFTLCAGDGVQSRLPPIISQLATIGALGVHTAPTRLLEDVKSLPSVRCNVLCTFVSEW